MMKKIFILFVSMILVAFNPQEEMELLRSIFKNISRQSVAVNPEQVFYMSYSLSTFNVDSTEQPISSTIEVWTKNKLVEVKSPQMQVYQDSKDAFIILPLKHLIVRNDADTIKNAEMNGKKMLAMYDSLLRYSSISASEKVKATGYDKHIAIKVNEKGQEMFGVSKADYWIDSNARTIKKVRICYAAESAQYNAQISYVDYMINKMEYDHKGKKLSNNVALNFLKNNKLKENYKGYTLVDNRVAGKK